MTRALPGVPRADRLVLGFVGSQPAKAIERYSALAAWLARSAGYREGVVDAHSDTDVILGRLCDGTLDVMFESPFSASLARQSCGAAPVVVAAKDGVLRYRSVIIVRHDAALRSLADLRGRSIGFEDDRSTSGYVIPRLLLENAGVELQPAASAPRPGAARYTFLREELNLVGAVVHGHMDAAALSDRDLQMLSTSEVRILARSEPVPRQVAVLAPTLAAEARQRIERALLLAPHAPDARSALERAGTREFAPLEPGDEVALAMLAERSRKTR